MCISSQLQLEKLILFVDTQPTNLNGCLDRSIESNCSELYNAGKKGKQNDKKFRNTFVIYLRFQGYLFLCFFFKFAIILPSLLFDFLQIISNAVKRVSNDLSIRALFLIVTFSYFLKNKAMTSKQQTSSECTSGHQHKFSRLIILKNLLNQRRHISQFSAKEIPDLLFNLASTYNTAVAFI